MTEDQARARAYHLLNPPLPIQNRDPLAINSLLSFTSTHNESIINSMSTIYPNIEQRQALNAPSINNKKLVHEIGSSLPALFQDCIYKSHDSLLLDNNDQFASCKVADGCKLTSSFQMSLTGQPSNCLQFQSRFQSGNLALVSRVPSDEKAYYLALQRDINTDNHTTQWFYFRVVNKANLGLHTFHIVNLVKPYSTFCSGMKPCVQSLRKRSGWLRGGQNVRYIKNSLTKTEDNNYYTLSFSYQFQQQDDEVYFAYCYPYTYTKLCQLLDHCEQQYGDRMKRKLLTKTVGNNVVEVVSITNSQLRHKKIIFIVARAHPGETVASFVCESIILFMLSDHPEAEKIRNQFVVKIVPMLNPDGVINGNYRTSLSGDDLNRQWCTPDPIKHPEVFHLRKLIASTDRKKVLFIDLHGHSKKKSSFMYGCTNNRQPHFTKQLPYLLAKQCPQFTYTSCNFATSRSKEGTSRMTMWKLEGINLSYTFEVSFCGPLREKRHFVIEDYHRLGQALCKTISTYFYCRVLELQINQELQRTFEQLYANQLLMAIGGEQTNGSSSELDDQTVKEPPYITPLKHKAEYEEPIKHNIISTYVNNHEPLPDHRNRSIKQLQKQQGQHQELRRSKESFRAPQKEESYIRHRKYVTASKINVQRIELQGTMLVKQLATNTSMYGLIAAGLDEMHSCADKLQTGNNTPHSCKNFKPLNMSVQMRNSFGVLFPNTLTNQYKKYQREHKPSKELKQSAKVTSQSLPKSSVTNVNPTSIDRKRPNRRL